MRRRNPVRKDAERVIRWGFIDAHIDAQVDIQGVKEFAEKIRLKDISHWTEYAPVSFDDLRLEDQLYTSFIFNTISFNYDTRPNWWQVEHEGRFLERGTWSMLAAVRRAFEESSPLLSCRYLADTSEQDIEHMLRGKGRLGMHHVRASHLREIGTVLLEKYNGSVTELITSEKDPLKLVSRIIKDFPSFRDESPYGRKTIQFNKRAQLFVSDAYHILGHEPEDTMCLTACADYILPRALRKENVLFFNGYLEDAINEGRYIPRHSKWEVEIRAATIVAVDLIRDFLQPRLRVTPMQVNDYIWTKGEFYRSLPFHRTYTNAY